MNKPNYSLRLTVRSLTTAIILLLASGAFNAGVQAKMPGYFQQKAISGKVLDEKGDGLANVSVAVKGATRGTVTKADGSFTINANSGETIIFSMVGYKPSTIVLKDEATLSVTLTVDVNSSMGEVVVVGYATQKKVTVTGSVAQIKGADLEKSPAVNISNSLVGRLPGVTAIQSSGEPGYDGSSIRIRGTNTLGNSDALIVIDGIPDREGGLERLNPSDIESFSVLKDASAAIYGARAANGVILITTKRGKSGKPSLSYDFNQGWGQATVIPKLMNAEQYSIANNELVLFNSVPADQWAAAWPALNTAGSYTRTDGSHDVVNAAYKPEDIAKSKDGSDPWGHPNTDWYGDALKKWAPQQKHTVQINGGSENVRYLASLGYLDQDGYYKNSATGYKQYDIRLNLDVKVNKYINTSLSLSGREEYRFFPTESAGSIFRMLMRGKPTEPEIWPNGKPGPDIENGQNPVVIATNQTGYDKDKRDYLQASGKIEINIPGIEGLKLTGTAALDKFYGNRKLWQTPWYLYFWDKSSYEADGTTPLLTKSVRSTYTDPRLSLTNETKLNVLLGAMLNYDKKIGNHTINLLAALTKETIKDDNFNAFRRNYISPSIDQLFAGGDAQKDNGGSAYERARLSYFGRVAYNYKEKYLAEFLWRYDGSYIFPEASRFGFFPGVLVGWNISQENFFKNVSFINNLKLRASWGQMGNDQVFYNNVLQEYAYLSLFGLSTYVLDDKLQKSLVEGVLKNPDFTWEVANNSNIGLEGTLFNNKISFEFDYFYNKRTQILWQRSGSTPASAGIHLPPANFGKIENKGYEFKVGYSANVGQDWQFRASVNGGYAKNKILYFDELPGAPAWQQATGKGFGTSGVNYLAYEYDGIFATQADIDKNTLDYSDVAGTLRPGDMKFKDINGDGKINGDDQTRLEKNRDPTFTGGVSLNVQYKNFDLSILFQGATGGLLFIGTESGDIGNYLSYSWDHRWSVDNPSSVDPRLANRGDTYYTGGGYGNNTYWLRSSNYLRLKNVELGYNLPQGLGKRYGINNFRVYVNALNIATWDKMKLYDPEAITGNGQYYPQSKVLNVGFRVTF